MFIWLSIKVCSMDDWIADCFPSHLKINPFLTKIISFADDQSQPIMTVLGGMFKLKFLFLLISTKTLDLLEERDSSFRFQQKWGKRYLWMSGTYHSEQYDNPFWRWPKRERYERKHWIKCTRVRKSTCFLEDWWYVEHQQNKYASFNTVSLKNLWPQR